MEDSAYKFLKERAKEAIDGKGLTEAHILMYILKRLSCAFQKGVANVLTNRLYGVMCPRKTLTSSAAPAEADLMAFHAPTQAFEAWAVVGA